MGLGHRANSRTAWNMEGDPVLQHAKQNTLVKKDCASSERVGHLGIVPRLVNPLWEQRSKEGFRAFLCLAERIHHLQRP